MMSLTYRGRLPGVLCQIQGSAQKEDSLQLDVTGFVGFAERGPLDTPVLLEDFSQYETIFGGDLLLAQENGVPVYAYLPETVRSFFDNGGRRCYVVRVAGEDARPCRFAIPGLIFKDDDTEKQIVASARWVGDWSEDVRLQTRLLSEPMRFSNWTGQQLSLDVRSRDLVQPGDVLRLQFSDNTFILGRLKDVLSESYNPRFARSISITVTFDNTSIHAFRQITPLEENLPQQIEVLGETGWNLQSLGVTWPHNDGYVIKQNVVNPGDVVRVTLEGDTSPVIFVVSGTDSSHHYQWVRRGENLEVDPITGDPLSFDDVPVAKIEKLVDEAWISLAVSDVTPLAQGYVVESATTIEPEDVLRMMGENGETVALFIVPYSQTMEVAQSDEFIQLIETNLVDAKTLKQVDLLTFDLIITEGQGKREVWSSMSFADWYAPFEEVRVQSWHHSMDDYRNRSLLLQIDPVDDMIIPLGRTSSVNVALPEEQTTRRDGLDTFLPETLFLDADLRSTGYSSLLSEVNYRLYISQSPKPLRKLHSLLPIEDVSLIAIPDLYHRPWSPIFVPPTPPSTVVEKPIVEIVGFHECQIETEKPEEVIPQRVEQGNIAERAPELDSPLSYDVTPLLNVIQALIEICAARADVLAILGLPHHFTNQDILSFIQQLVSKNPPTNDRVLSYSALYFPWIGVIERLTPDASPLRYIPPDGSICGMIARRTLARGPWIAPANEPLQGITGLPDTYGELNGVALYNQQVNLIKHTMGHFTLLSALTLGRDPDYVQISVRRLMIYLRKQAFLNGQEFMFETNNARFRQMVQMRFESLLQRLVELGGLVDFQVVTGPEVNTTLDEDQGRFIVALKVAPTLPVEFITVVLVRTGENLLEVRER